MTTVFAQATYDPACVYKPPLFLLDPARPDYGCHPGSWGADFVEPIQSLVAEHHAADVEAGLPEGVVVQPSRSAE